MCVFCVLRKVTLILKQIYLDQSGPGSDINKGILHIPQISETGASPLDVVYSNTQAPPFW